MYKLGQSSSQISNQFGQLFISVFTGSQQLLQEQICLYQNQSFYSICFSFFYLIMRLVIIIISFKVQNQNLMDYNINLEEQKGSYSPQSQPKNINIQHAHNIRLEKPEDNMTGNSSPQKKGNQSMEGKQPPSGCTKFCKIDFYQQFFQVTQAEVLQRVKLAFIPIKTQFIQQLNGNPDFYGPFWLLTTIIFLVSSTGNLSRYFYNWTKDQYIFKLELVRYAVLIVYMFGFGVPTALYFILKFLGNNKPNLPEMICLYGYSLSCFIPIFLLCIIPVQVVQWLLISYGMVNTIVFLIFNIKDYLAELEKPKTYLIYGLIGGAQIALFLTFKLVFFKMVYQQVSQA